MPGTARKVVITERQQECLQRLTRSSTCPQAVAQRAQMILGAFAGQENQEIAVRVGCERHAPGLWRRRWAKAFSRLAVIECVEKTSTFVAAVMAVLSDAPRRGGPMKFTAEQVALILAVACEPPAQSGRPVTHWTPRELADEVVKRGIVSSISERQIGRFLKSGRNQAAFEPLLAEQPSERRPRVFRPGAGNLPHVPGGGTLAAGKRHAYRKHG